MVEEELVSGRVVPTTRRTVGEDASTPRARGEAVAQPPRADEAEYKRGLAIVGGITLLFASNSPALHAAFTATESAPPFLLLNALVSIVALSGLLFGGALMNEAVPLPSTLDRSASASFDQTSLLAGLELGGWKMLGTTANLYGLSLTSADHGAFLIQLTTFIVPLVQGLRGVPIPPRIWQAIGLAVGGLYLFTQDPGSSGSSLLGDGFCVLAAGLYATYDLRLFHWGSRVQPRPLITTKIAVQALLSVALLLVADAPNAYAYLQAAAAGASTDGAPLALLATVALWCGVMVNAVAPFLQVSGQQAIGPARAQVLYASQPLWAALLSYALLHETVGLEGAAGGALFLAAVLLAATAPAPDPDCEDENCEV